MTHLLSPVTGRSSKRKLSGVIAALVISLSLLALSGCGLIGGNTPTPTPPPSTTVTPEEQPANSSPAQPQPTATPLTDVLGPAPVTDTTYLHPPFAQEQCGTCHDLTNKENPKELWGPVVEVCRVCHWQVIDAEQPSHIHDPFPEGECLSCHAPHASGEAFLFKAPQGEVCRECHDEVPEQPHPPIATEECLLCHAGHGSEQEVILREPMADLCARCHADHTQEGVAFGPHAEEAQECSLCHDPHTGEFQDQVETNGCGECHEEVVQANPRVPHDPVSDDECLKCHVFHQEDQYALLAKPQPAICRGCHEPGKPGAQTHPRIAQGECLLCHAGHGNEQEAILRKDERELCSTCHDDKVVATASSIEDHFNSEDLPLCDNCHDPHNGTHDPIDLAEGCSQCHTDEAPPITALREASQDIHKPMREEGCVACHDFHKVQVDHPIGDVSATDLCLECHEDLPHDAHPVSGEPDPWHGGDLSCASCHSAHDTQYPANVLVPGDALCLECHELGQ